MRRTSRLPQSLGLTLSLASVAACSGCVAEPLPWQDSAPMARMFLQLPFEAPATTPQGTLSAGVGLLNANSIIRASSPELDVDIHLETAQLTTMVRYGLSSRVELQLVVPVVIASSGFLDGPINAVESLFRARNPLRLEPRSGETRFALRRSALQGRGTGPPSATIDMTRAGAGLGDVWAGVKLLIAEQSGGWPALAVRGALKVPTGQAPYGSGEVDVGGSLLAGWTLRPVGLWIQLDVGVPTGSLAGVPIATRPYGTVQVATAWEVLEGFSLHAQASGHTSPLGGTGLDELALPTFYVLLGSTVALTRSLDLTAGLVENVLSPGRGADFTVLLGMKAAL